jgi:hypothetical protein
VIDQLPQPRKKKIPEALIWTAAIGITLSGAMIVVGATMASRNSIFLAFAAAGSLGVVITVVATGLSIARIHSEAGSLQHQLVQMSRVMEQLAEQGSLSDDARRVVNRRRDRELLRRAIEDDINAEDWDAAMVLVKELAERFGYRADAEEFRARIEQSRYETVQRKVSDELSNLDALIRSHRWEQATAEAARITRLYPDSQRVEGLRHQVEHARRLYKSDLERRFLTAAEENRIGDAMELLRELDAYLTEAEAEPYRELARGVIGKARDNLGAQFKLAVQDRQWGRASEVGEQIIVQFPNSRMAEEVRALIEDIRARAREVAV